ncbi:LapA family protein [Salirhabdus salicampi]|uniref:LapA family protein n=1 Tax=Salirhabdus salicampi TaxID=476102 RepID=UPI0020C48F08|nr:lipopolysaccharide assembly protein LapA domain-containing protein [Salirhabdus salicampi]MCP8616980.1 lipopolysaccharide assembly protein LapA domain-containing protein [Salirhabdus salicampi]
MKGQTSFILAIVFAIIIAIFAIINVDAVPVNFLFYTSQSPLILVILFSVLMGSIVTAGFGAMKLYRLQKDIRLLRAENEQLREQTKAEEQTIQPEENTEEEIEKTGTTEKGKQENEIKTADEMKGK